VTARVDPEASSESAPQSEAASARATPSFTADLVALTKPRITRMVIATTAAGAWLATRRGIAEGTPAKPLGVLAIAIFGTILVVAGANALNMYLERDTDGLMERTRDRPLPTGRMSPDVALWFGIALSSSSLALLFAAVNLATGLLALFALGAYVLVYTPLKRKTTLSLPIGAVPGAIPPLLGWTAVTGRVDAPGLALFGILFLWQVPHFLAIATFRRTEYHRAGHKVLPVERGDRVTRVHIVLYIAALVGVSLLLVPLGVAGTFYLVAASLLGAGFLGLGLAGLSPSAGVGWARWLFVLSIPYLVLLFAALMVPL
jgi:protoheme IX farnesyltransferase